MPRKPLSALKSKSGKAPTPPPVATAAPVADPLPGLIDELGRLETELAPYALKLARIEALRKGIRSVAPADPPDIGFVAHGAEYSAQFGPRAKETVIDYGKLVELIGAESFAKFATTTQKTLFAKVQNNLHLALVLRTELTGPRALKVVPRHVKDGIEAKAA